MEQLYTTKQVKKYVSSAVAEYIIKAQEDNVSEECVANIYKLGLVIVTTLDMVEHMYKQAKEEKNEFAKKALGEFEEDTDFGVSCIAGTAYNKISMKLIKKSTDTLNSLFDEKD